MGLGEGTHPGPTSTCVLFKRTLYLPSSLRRRQYESPTCIPTVRGTVTVECAVVNRRPSGATTPRYRPRCRRDQKSSREGKSRNSGLGTVLGTRRSAVSCGQRRRSIDITTPTSGTLCLHPKSNRTERQVQVEQKD